MCLLFIISLKFLQQNILETSLTAKVIVPLSFPLKNIVFYKNIYVIVKSEDTSECAKLHHLKNIFCGNMPPNPLAMCPKTRRPQILSKNDTPMTCWNMELRPFPGQYMQ